MTVRQPNIPFRFRVPGVVQPKWSFSDLHRSCFIDEYESSLNKEICRQYGVKYCLLLNDARSGIYFLAKNFGLQGEWITTSFMYQPLSEIIRNFCSGFALADINKNFTINIESTRSLIGSNTEVLLVNHFYGKCSEVKALRLLADEHKLFLIENCVHVPGNTIVDNKPIGSWGDAAIVSFKADKAFGGIGGGALITNREDVFNSIKEHVNREKKYLHTLKYIISNTVAYKLRPCTAVLIRLYNNIQNLSNEVVPECNDHIINESLYKYSIGSAQAKVALLLSNKLGHLKNNQIEKGRCLSKLINDVEGISCPEDVAKAPHTYTYFPIVLNSIDRMVFANKLSKNGIETKWRYHALHSLPFKDVRWHDVSCTNHVLNQNILLPLGIETKLKHLKYIAKCVSEAMRQ
ncbi:MAG: hypothetical protein GKR92_12750 [Gammaproteobacteria bacterium]|nr:MAG: hypothetical protein GKR92_12750 [Gammaproteobacteria bacterium]